VDIDSLRLYADLAETGSFSKTAERCFMSQSAVSQRIRTLEKEFGQVLVERGKGRPGAQLTEAGERLLEGAREIVARADALKRELGDMGDMVSGALHVATVYSIGLHSLTPALARYLSEYSQVNLRLEYLRTDRIYEALRNGAIDCGVVACPREQAQVEVVPLASEEMVVVATPGHPLADGGEISVTRLNGAPFIAFAQGIPTRLLIDGLLNDHEVSVDVIQAFDNIETIKQAVEIGLGVAIVPEPTIRREVRGGSLVARPLEPPGLARPTGVLLRRGRVRRRALARFLDVLVGYAAGSLPHPPGVGPACRGLDFSV
jgi:molybdate transport repressor ModE-like protein